MFLVTKDRLEMEIDGRMAQRTMDILMNHCEKHIKFKSVGTIILKWKRDSRVSGETKERIKNIPHLNFRKDPVVLASTDQQHLHCRFLGTMDRFLHLISLISNSVYSSPALSVV
jgi:hypothetical protein